MRKAVLVILCAWSVLICVPAQSDTAPESAQTRFATVRIYLDSGAESLAAYQFEFKALTGQVKIVGVEGGDHPAFSEPPYYDPAALMNNRIIIAAFNTGNDLPKGKTRIATLHLQIIGRTAPDYDIQLSTAATPDGRRINPEITYEQGDNQ